MTQELILIGHSNLDIAVEHYALTAEARIDARINSPVDKILFLVGYFLDVIHPPVYVNVAGAASANPAAVVLQFYAVLQAYVQNRFTFGNGQLNAFQTLFLKVYL